MNLKRHSNQILCLPERPWPHEREPPDLCRTDRRRAALGHHGAAVQAGPALAATGLAHLRALCPGRRDPPPGSPPPAAGRVPARRAGLRRGRLRRVCPAAERRHHPDQRHPRRTADRHGPGAGRDHRGGLAPGRSAPGGMGGLRAVTGRRRPGRRWPWRRSEHRRGRAGARVAACVGHLHGGADPPAGRPRPHCRHSRAVPGGRAGRAAVRGGHRGHARRPARAGPGGGNRGPGSGRHAAALRPVRLRAEPGGRRGGRDVPQHRAVRRCRGGRGVLRRPCPPRTARRGRGRPRGHRAEQPPDAGRQPRGGTGLRP